MWQPKKNVFLRNTCFHKRGNRKLECEVLGFRFNFYSTHLLTLAIKTKKNSSVGKKGIET